MTDIKIIVEAARQLNQAWVSFGNLEKEDIPNDVYNVLCEIDEAITNLIDKIGEASKVILVSEMFKKH